MRIAIVTALVALSVAGLGGCKATRDFDTTPAGAGPNSMLDDTAVGRSRCAGGQIDTSPFVVEWDATDLSTFEAQASRDLVFVRYADCAIELLRGCSDGGIPGRYGRYREPVFTSGTVESFSMKDEDELWAKLPLGAARFGAAVKVGQSLELRYHVSGVSRPPATPSIARPSAATPAAPGPRTSSRPTISAPSSSSPTRAPRAAPRWACRARRGSAARPRPRAPT